VHKKILKVHSEAPIYNLTNDDMDQIKYQAWDDVEEAIKEETNKQEKMHQQV